MTHLVLEGVSFVEADELEEEEKQLLDALPSSSVTGLKELNL